MDIRIDKKVKYPISVRVLSSPPTRYCSSNRDSIKTGSASAPKGEPFKKE
ncbi:MAG: hypothetical protein JW861_13430 [Bacteroidales bacterium]|nr:hypothetical protein [Bacteroidales bacterium]